MSGKHYNLLRVFCWKRHFGVRNTLSYGFGVARPGRINASRRRQAVTSKRFWEGLEVSNGAVAGNFFVRARRSRTSRTTSSLTQLEGEIFNRAICGLVGWFLGWLVGWFLLPLAISILQTLN